MARRTLRPDPLRRRLAPLIAAYFFGGLWLWVAVEKLFLAEIGFTPQSIGVMAAAYAAVVPVLELPSGILADRWSRRGVLMLGNAGAFLSVLVGGLSTSVGAYLVAALLLGVYLAMQSGTFDAVVYDTVLEEAGTSDRFEALLGRVRMAESASLVLSALAGGLLATLTTPRTTYFLTLPFLVVSTLCLLAFREPTLHRRGVPSSLRRHLSVTFGVFRRDRRLVPVGALMVLMAMLTQAMFEFGPLWLVADGAGPGTFGPAWAGLMAALGIGGAVAAKVRSGSRRHVGASVALLAASSGVLITAHHPAVVTLAQIALVVVAVAAGIVLTRVLHDAVPSDIRSGVASGVSAAAWLVFLPFAVGFGVVSEWWGVNAAGWMVLAVAGAASVLLVGAFGRSSVAGEGGSAVSTGEAALRPAAA